MRRPRGTRSDVSRRRTVMKGPQFEAGRRLSLLIPEMTKPRVAAGLRVLGSPTGLAVAVAHAARAVVAAELVAVVLVAVPLVVELRRVLDLILRAVDEHRFGIEIEVTNDSGREHHLLAEDPRARVDDDEAAAGLVGRLVDLADAPVERLDLEAGQVDGRTRAGAERPDFSDRHFASTPLRRPSPSIVCMTC